MSYQIMIRKLALSSIVALILQSCAIQDQEPAVGEGVAPGEVNISTITTLDHAEVYAREEDTGRQRIIADLLFEGLQALDADRLLTPVDDNAHARFKRVLAYDPNNEIAHQGLKDIVIRYIELAGDATRQGLFSDAELMIERAQFVDDHPAITQAWIDLQEEINSGDLFFKLDDREFARRSETAQEQLKDIARQAEKHNAFFLITAPNDDLARWMFSVMREAVEGYRLRGNIELTVRTSIRLRITRN